MYKEGEILKGKINGAEIKIIEVTNWGYKWQDLKTLYIGHTDKKTFEHKLFDKI